MFVGSLLILKDNEVNEINCKILWLNSTKNNLEERYEVDLLWNKFKKKNHQFIFITCQIRKL